MAKQVRSWQHPSLLVILIAGAVTVFFLIAIGREFFQTQQVHRQLSRLRSEVQSEQTRQKQLQGLLSYLSSPTFQERQARLELGLKGEGERVVIVPDNGQTVINGQTVSSSTAEKSTTNPSRWWAYFFGTKNKVE